MLRNFLSRNYVRCTFCWTGNCKNRALKLTRQDEKKLAKRLTIYKKKGNFSADNFGDGGHLAHTNEYEDDKGESMVGGQRQWT